MDIRCRVRNLIEHSDGGPPWAFGFDPTNGTPEAIVVWRSLTLEEKLLISKYSPFRVERNELIRQLKELRISQKVICELSGLRMDQLKHVNKLQEIGE